MLGPVELAQVRALGLAGSGGSSLPAPAAALDGKVLEWNNTAGQFGDGSALLAGTSVQPADLGRNNVPRKLWDKIYKVQNSPPARVKWLTFGDSYAQILPKWYLPYLIRALGGQAGTYFSQTSPISGVTQNTSSGTVTPNLGDFAHWPSGLTTTLGSSGASVTYGTVGSSVVCDTIKVYGLNAGGGYKIQVDGVDNTTPTVTSDNSLLISTIAVARGAHTVTIVQTSGTPSFVGVGFEDSTLSGLVPINVSQGGIALDDAMNNAQARTNLQAFVTDVAPDVFTSEMKEGSSYVTGNSIAVSGQTYQQRLTQLYGILTAAAPLMDIIGIGSSPVLSGDSDQVLCNTMLKTAVTAAGGIYWDGYTPLVSWAKENSLGWGTDPVHLTDMAHQYRAGIFMRDLGLVGLYGVAYPFDFAAANGTVTGVFKVAGKSQSSPELKITADTSNGQDVDTRVGRWLMLKDQAGVNEYARLDLTGGQTSFLPTYTAVGSGNALLKGESAAYLSIRKGGATSTFGTLFARAFSLNSGTPAFAAGLTVDFSLGAIQVVTLTGNVTSLNLSGTGMLGNEEVELHLVQDATGSRTLAGVNVSVHFAGGTPTLTTTAGKRDVFKFRYISGVWYETSRSLNV